MNESDWTRDPPLRRLAALAHVLRHQVVPFQLYHVILKTGSALTAGVHSLHQTVRRRDEHRGAVLGIERDTRGTGGKLKDVEHPRRSEWFELSVRGMFETNFELRVLTF